MGNPIKMFSGLEEGTLEIGRVAASSPSAGDGEPLRGPFFGACGGESSDKSPEGTRRGFTHGKSAAGACSFGAYLVMVHVSLNCE